MSKPKQPVNRDGWSASRNLALDLVASQVRRGGVVRWGRPGKVLVTMPAGLWLGETDEERRRSVAKAVTGARTDELTKEMRELTAIEGADLYNLLAGEETKTGCDVLVTHATSDGEAVVTVRVDDADEA